MGKRGRGAYARRPPPLEPFLKRAFYNPQAENATVDEIAQSALGNMIISTILGVGLDGMKAVDDGVSGWMNNKTADPGTGKAGYTALTPEEIAAHYAAEQKRIQEEELFAELERDWYENEDIPTRTEETEDDWDEIVEETIDSQWEDAFTSMTDESIMKMISGAHITDTESPAATEHAEKYYGLARSMNTDVARIAGNTGYSEREIKAIKDFIFNDLHDLGDSATRRFDPSFAMAQSWQRLINGTPEPHDITMLKHEQMEMELMKKGMSQYDAHIEASKKYNYAKESEEYYAALEKH